MTMTRRLYATPEESFLARTEPLCWSDCIIWTGAASSGGYGSLRVNGRMVKAHRYAWERANGPIPEGVEIDHICHIKACVNVEHLRPASRTENRRNLAGAYRNNRSTGVRGVTRKKSGMYEASLGLNGRRRYLGTFPTIERAEIAVTNARRFYFGEYAGN